MGMGLAVPIWVEHSAMANLTDDQLRTIQHLLDERQRELQEELRVAKAARAERTSAQAPNVEDAAENSEQRLHVGLEHVEIQRDEEELRAIHEARDRIGEGTYGDCIDCGRAIPFERLKAQPIASRCIDCQSRYEHKHHPSPRYAV
jgi:RNA polymerase-binding protein DksA